MSATLVMPCGDRPLASTMWQPASRARRTASPTAGAISSYVVPAPSTHFSSVPSMSRATSFGVHAWLLMHRLEHLEAAHVGTERQRHRDRPVGVLVRLEDRHDRARARAERAVERRHRSGALGEPAPDVEPAGLELGAVGGRGELAVAA